LVRPSNRFLRCAAGIAGGALALVLVPFPYGVAVAAGGGPAVAAVVQRLAERPERRRSDPGAALALVLAAAALRAGAPVVTAIELAAPAADPATAAVLAQIAERLRLGASPEQAWSVLPDDRWSSVAVLARRSGHSGIKLASAFDRAADQILAQQRAAAVARAHRVGVLAVGPLGACFLPAFVCLGIVPVVVAVASGLGSQLS
jgi:pilus assembly protein TadC